MVASVKCLRCNIVFDADLYGVMTCPSCCSHINLKIIEREKSMPERTYTAKCCRCGFIYTEKISVHVPCPSCGFGMADMIGSNENTESETKQVDEIEVILTNLDYDQRINFIKAAREITHCSLDEGKKLWDDFVKNGKMHIKVPKEKLSHFKNLVSSICTVHIPSVQINVNPESRSLFKCTFITEDEARGYLADHFVEVYTNDMPALRDIIINGDTHLLTLPKDITAVCEFLYDQDVLKPLAEKLGVDFIFIKCEGYSVMVAYEKSNEN